MKVSFTEVLYPAKTFDPGVIIDNKNLHKAIKSRLKRIPAGQRDIFKKWLGFESKQYSIYEISDIKKIPWKRVRMWVNLALRNLRNDRIFIQILRENHPLFKPENNYNFAELCKKASNARW